LLEIIGDEGISGLQGRPGLAEALRRIENDEASVLVLYRLDRLARDLLLQETVVERLPWAVASVISVSEPDVDSHELTRILIRQVLAAISQYVLALGTFSDHAVCSFGDIHGDVGFLKQSFGIDPISRKDRKSRADVDVDRPGTDDDRHLETVGHASGHSQAFLFRGTREQDRELIAPKPGDRIAVSSDHDQSSGHFSQYLITCCVAESVVDVLELVEIEHEYDKFLVRAPSSLKCVIEAIAEEHTIGQISERVVHS